MLAKLTDTDGDVVWINPIHVRSVQTSTGLFGGHKGTQVWMSSELVSGHRVVVKESPCEAAAMLNDAMPRLIDAGTLLSDDRTRRDDTPPQPAPPV